MKPTRLLASVVLLATTSLSMAEIKYTVTPDAASNRLKVSMSFSAKKGDLELQMPNWAPGAYFLGEPGRNVTDLAVFEDSGKIGVTHPANHSWKTTVPWDGVITVTYTVASPMENGAMHFSGPSTYVYVVGRKTETCKVTIDAPTGWKTAIGLDEVRGSTNTYSAKDYDVLSDNPVTMGDFIELSYTSHRKPHTIAIRGANREKIDPAKIIAKCQLVSDSQGDFFGGLPFNKYVWHFAVMNVPDGAGGLEHLSSTQISLGYDVGPRAVSVLSHEYFHLWNVKRIRSSVLGPFDYTVLPKTGALYWLEGTTDYYASLLNYRYEISDEAIFLNDIVRNTSAVRNNEARLRISPFESSMRVGEANGGRGNSNGFEISYYNLGWLVGLVLDMEIRSRTDGSRSLDDVMFALWNMCKNDQRGFSEDEIRKQCVRFGGKGMGEVFDKVVMTPGELPLEDALAKVGYVLSTEQEPYNDPGFTFSPQFRSREIRVASITSAGKEIGLQANDVLVEIGGVPVDLSEGKNPMGQVSDWVKSLTPGTSTKIVVMRGENRVEATLVPVIAHRTIWKVTDSGTKDVKTLSLRNGWVSARK